jgi:hypothetical protein
VGEYVVVTNRGRFFAAVRGKRRQVPPDVTWHYCECRAGQMLQRHDEELEALYGDLRATNTATWTRDLMKVLTRQAQERKATVLHRQCAWCGKDLGETDGEGVEGVSHGMCEACAKNYASEDAIAEALAEKGERRG